MTEHRHNDTKSSNGVELRYSSQFLSIKDLITIVSVAVSLALAWGVFSTRLAILEKEVLELHALDAKLFASNEALVIQLKRIEVRVQDNQQFIDELYRGLKRPLPRRYNDSGQ